MPGREKQSDNGQPNPTGRKETYLQGSLQTPATRRHAGGVSWPSGDKEDIMEGCLRNKELTVSVRSIQEAMRPLGSRFIDRTI